jgi:flagellum-specific ATP synthase
MSDIVDPELLKCAADVRDVLASYQEVEDLITIGAYKPGQNPRVDRAVALHDKVEEFLKQSSEEGHSLNESWRSMFEIVGR